VRWRPAIRPFSLGGTCLSVVIAIALAGGARYVMVEATNGGLAVRARELAELLAAHSGYPIGEIDQRIRPLRERDRIPHGPRGRNAPHLDPSQAAYALSCMVARRPSDVDEVISRLENLVCDPSSDKSDDRLFHMLSFPYVLSGAIVLGSTAFQRVEICCDGSMAWADVFYDGKQFRLRFSDVPGEKDRDSSYCGHRSIIPGDLIDEVGRRIHSDLRRELKVDEG
jgi:hypothetical protein